MTTRAHFESDEHAPLVGVPMQRDGREGVAYSTSDVPEGEVTEADVATALSLAGAWRDLDSWESVEYQLDEIRHGTPPTSPLAL